MERLFLIQKPEAKYSIYFNDGTQFSIDCSCNGKPGYSLKKPSEAFEAMSREYHNKKNEEALQHTFCMDETIFLTELAEHYMEKNHQPNLEIICGNCKKVFGFSYESYFDLRKEIESLAQKEIEA